MTDSIDVKFIIYVIMDAIFYSEPKNRILQLTPMTNKESNKTTETTIEDATKFNSETHQVISL